MNALKLATMPEEKRNEFLNLEQQIKELEARQKAIVRNVQGVTFKTCATKSGKVGITVHGLGKPQFFYKSHFLALIGEGQEAEQIRAKARQWVAENDAQLSNKEEE